MRWSIESNMLCNLIQIQIVFTFCNRTAVSMAFGEGLSYLGLKCNNLDLAAITYVLYCYKLNHLESYRKKLDNNHELVDSRKEPKSLECFRQNQSPQHIDNSSSSRVLFENSGSLGGRRC